MKAQPTNEEERVLRWPVNTPGQWLPPLLFSVALALLVTAGSPAVRAADSPHLIPFQGHLTRPSASEPGKFEPVPAGRYDILFTLYASPVGGESKIWGPERHSQLTVVSGSVNAILGAVIGFQDALATDPNLFARPLYVGITVDVDGNPTTADLELVPRQVLVPSVYAMNANKLDGYDWHDVFANGNPTTTILSSRIANNSITGQKLAPQTITSNQIAPHTITELNLGPSLTMNSIIPPGTITAFGGSEANVPAGWLLCNGAVVLSNDYPLLFAAIGTSWGQGSAAPNDFQLPDLRGLFLRGVQGGRSDSLGDPEAQSRNGGNAVGSYQGDRLGSHKHAVPTDYGIPGSGDYFSLVWSGGDDEGYTNAPGTDWEGGLETRPKNAYVNYIIKY